MDPHMGGSRLDATASPDSKPSSPSGDKPKLRVVERGSQACNECRRHKIRCHPAPDDPDHIKSCARCVRMSLQCVFKKHNRGRKRKNPPPSDMPADIALAPKQPHFDSPTASAATSSARLPAPPAYWNRDTPDRALFSSVSRYPFMTLDPPPREHERVGGPPRPPPPPTQPQSVSLRSMVHPEPWDGEEEEEVYSDTDSPPGETSELAVRDRERERDRHMDRPGSSHFPQPPSGGHANDPVSLGYLNVDEASAMFDLFVKYFNVAMPILDPVAHTHDVVRQQSPFLYTVILCIASRYMNPLGLTPGVPTPLSANQVHQQIVILARDHLMWSFAEAASTIDVVQAIVALCLWKEPDDDKAAFYFNRGIVLAKELGLGRNPPASEVARMSGPEKRELRHRQRLWMSLFSTNSIFHMQFRQPMLISHNDPLISTCTFWLKHAAPEHVLMDTFVAFSADLRRRYLHYRQLLSDDMQPGALTLSVLTKTMNREWEVTSEAWIQEIIDAGGTPAYVHKPRVWYSSLGLNLNLMILNQTLRIPPAERVPPAIPSLGSGSSAQLRSIPAFHQCLNDATSVLLRFHDLDRTQLTYASDTLLHFALYAATFLWSLCRTPELYDFESAEVDYTRDLILKVAATLEAGSAYPHSSPALHAKYLRKLCRSHQRTRSQYSSSEAPSLVAERAERAERADGHPLPLPHGVGVPPMPMAFDGPYNSQGATLPAGANGELDVLLGEFPWVGVDLPWTPVDPALFGVGVHSQQGHALPPDTSHGPQFQNGLNSRHPPPLM